MHRQLGVHITKVKSVNLDKWPAGKIDLFKAVNNELINSFWEKNLPKHFKKPGSNASNAEVTEFMTNKYVKKKWANNDDWSNDPATLFETNKKKFNKYVKYYQEHFINGGGAKEDTKLDDSDDSDKPKKTKKKEEKPQKLS